MFERYGPIGRVFDILNFDLTNLLSRDICGNSENCPMVTFGMNIELVELIVILLQLFKEDTVKEL